MLTIPQAEAARHTRRAATAEATAAEFQLHGSLRGRPAWSPVVYLRPHPSARALDPAILAAATHSHSAAYNWSVSSPVKQVAVANFPTRWGDFRIYGFEGNCQVQSGGLSPEEANRLAREGKVERRKEEAVALVMGDIHSAPPLVRIHSQCLTGDVFGSMRCDCRQQLELALALVAEAGAGILIYEQQEGRGIGLMAKIQAYELQDKGLDTIEANEKLGYDADYRQYTLPAEMLKQLGVSSVRLISNNPEKVAALEHAGISVVERVSAEVEPYEHAEKYLQTKKDRMGHLFTSF